MSKKTRKKSSKIAAAAKAVRASRTAIGQGACQRGCDQNPQEPSQLHQARASRKASNSASLKASHKAASKPLKSPASAAGQTGPASALVEGAPAPSFDLPRDGGGRVSSADHAGKKLVLFFYPPRQYARLHQGGNRLHPAQGRVRPTTDTQVLGISADTVKAQDSPSGISINWPFR